MLENKYYQTNKPHLEKNFQQNVTRRVSSRGRRIALLVRSQTREGQVCLTCPAGRGKELWFRSARSRRTEPTEMVEKLQALRFVSWFRSKCLNFASGWRAEEVKSRCSLMETGWGGAAGSEHEYVFSLSYDIYKVSVFRYYLSSTVYATISIWTPIWFFHL